MNAEAEKGSYPVGAVACLDSQALSTDSYFHQANHAFEPVADYAIMLIRHNAVLD